jgi:glycosyltransferase involved in cell wall biosynthesis
MNQTEQPLKKNHRRTDLMQQLISENCDEIQKQVLSYVEKHHLQDGLKKIAIIIPAYNEEQALAAVLKDAPQKINSTDLIYLVIDDGSSDQTAAIAESFSHVITLKKSQNMGLGHSIATGLKCAATMGCQYAVTLDADGQHQFKDLATVVTPLLKNEADLVIGSRMLGATTMDDAMRLRGVRIFSRLISFLAGHTLTDCSSGYRGYRLSEVKKLAPTENRHYTPEAYFRAIFGKLRITEVPITILERQQGETKQGSNLRYGLRYCKSIFLAFGITRFAFCGKNNFLKFGEMKV